MMILTGVALGVIFGLLVPTTPTTTTLTATTTSTSQKSTTTTQRFYPISTTNSKLGEFGA